MRLFAKSNRKKWCMSVIIKGEYVFCA